MEEDRDILVLIDEDDQEIEMEILDYFTYEDQEYALLAPLDDACGCSHCDCDEHEHELYIMKVVVDGDMEEFHPVEEDMMESLIQAVEAIYGDDEYDEDEDFEE